MNTYGAYAAQKDGLLQPDGSVVTRSGETVFGADIGRARAYGMMEAQADKLLQPDGTIKTRTEIMQAGIAEAKTYTDSQIAQLGDIFIFKGRVDTYAQLPIVGNKAGHIWAVGLETDEELLEYIWMTTGKWEAFGKTTKVDLGEYYTKAEVGSYIKDQNAGNIIKKWYGSQVEYDAIAVKDEFTEYNIYEEG